MNDNRSLRSTVSVVSEPSIYIARLAARKQAFIDMHNDDMDPPVDIDGMDEDDDADVQLDVCDYMQQMGERLNA